MAQFNGLNKVKVGSGCCHIIVRFRDAAVRTPHQQAVAEQNTIPGVLACGVVLILVPVLLMRKRRHARIFAVVCYGY